MYKIYTVTPYSVLNICTRETYTKDNVYNASTCYARWLVEYQ